MIQFEFDQKIDNCIVCGNHNIINYMKDFRGINISKCSDCGFQFMNPQYTDRYLSEYYSTYTDSEDFNYWHGALLYGHDFYFSLIERYVSQGELLDIGCGNGHLMEAAIKRGWEVNGYDVDKNSTKMVSRRLGARIYSGDFFESFQKVENIYDLITLHQVLEHLKDPNAYLRKINTMIKNDGYLFVAVPNIGSLSNKIKFYLETKGFRKNTSGKYYDTSHHILYFEPDTLTSLLYKNGFKVLYKRNGHKTRPNQSKLKRFIMRNITDFLFTKSTFLVIAKKIGSSAN